MIERTNDVLERGLLNGEYIGAQLYISQGEQAVAEVALGERRPGVPMTIDSLPLWFSSCKPIGAAAIIQLRERGKLSLDDSVALHIPEFGQNGKQAITIRHLLTHTGGFRSVDIG